MPLTPIEGMRMAIAEARKGAGFVSPNPLVGCAVLDARGELLALGHHARVGGDHAEVHALSQIADRDRLKGAHVIVTLEPCAHEGRTPSCAKMLAQLPLGAVTYGLVDPNPLVSGKGALILEAAGISARPLSALSKELQDELHELCEIFLLNMQAKRPFVALKVATTLDGKVAMSDGTSQWITGEEARARVQVLRGGYDAVLAGSGTFLKDDPKLNARVPQFEGRPNRVVLLDPRGETLARLSGSQLMKVRTPDEVYLVTGPRVQPAVDGVQHLRLPLNDAGGFDLHEVLLWVQSHGMHSLFVEGGPQTYGSLLRSDLVDRLYLFMAPKILGEGLSWPKDYESADLGSAMRIEKMRAETLGPDLLVTGRTSRWSNH